MSQRGFEVVRTAPVPQSQRIDHRYSHRVSIENIEEEGSISSVDERVLRVVNIGKAE